MRVLFIGGTGLISSACSPAVIGAGHANPSRQAIDDDANQLWDRTCAIYTDALARAARLRG